MSYSRVREALPASHRCWAPPVSCQTNHESTVPRRTSSARHRSRQVEQPPHLGCGEHRVDPQTRSRVHQPSILLAEGLTAPGRRTPVLPADHRAQWRPGAGPPADHGLPLSRERDADNLGASGAPSKQAPIGLSTLVQIRLASCSTHLGRGDEIPTGAEPPDTRRPSALIRPPSSSSSPGRSPRSLGLSRSPAPAHPSVRQLFHVTLRHKSDKLAGCD